MLLAPLLSNLTFQLSFPMSNDATFALVSPGTPPVQKPVLVVEVGWKRMELHISVLKPSFLTGPPSLTK